MLPKTKETQTQVRIPNPAVRSYHARPTLPRYTAFVPAVGRAPATCGELVQGYIDGSEFLVNSPISLYSSVRVAMNFTGVVTCESEGTYSKVADAITKTLEHMGLDFLGAQFQVLTSVPRGKGLASSTSEVSAAIYATIRSLRALAQNRQLKYADIAKIAVSQDTSDGVYFPGVVRVNQLTGKLFESFGAPPPLSFVIVDCGGDDVDSLGFDRGRAREHAKKNEAGMRDALACVRRGFRELNPKLIACAATQSAEINQGVLFKREFSQLLMSTREAGALGVNCAHTGTVLGVMFDPRTADIEKILRTVETEMGMQKILGIYPLISGGLSA